MNDALLKIVVAINGILWEKILIVILVDVVYSLLYL